MRATTDLLLGLIRLALILVISLLGLILASCVLVFGLLAFAVLWLRARWRGETVSTVIFRERAARYARWGSNVRQAYRKPPAGQDVQDIDYRER
jgi:hypothetical protein